MRRSLPRPHRYGRMAAVLLLLLASGCSLDTEDDSIRILPIFNQPNTAPPEPDVLPTITVTTTTAGVITTSGQLVATCARGLVDAKYQRDGSDLELRVIYRPDPGCPSEPTLLTYNILLSNVPPGQYHFAVVHEGDRQVPTGTVVAEQDVTVF